MTDDLFRFSTALEVRWRDVDALGHVNQKLVTLQFAPNATPTAGTPVTQADQPVGTITTVGASQALAMIRRGANEIGTKLDSEHGPAEVIR